MDWSRVESLCRRSLILFIEVCCGLSFWHEACCGEGRANFPDFGPSGQFCGELGRDGYVLVAKSVQSH